MPTYLTKYAERNGLKMVDAKGPLTIELRASDVKRSKLKSATSCAFATCAKETVPGVKSAHFFRSTAWLEFSGRLVRFTLPPSMQKEIVSFDRARAMAPGIYTLSKPTKEHTLGAKRRRLARRADKSRVATGSGISTRVRHVTQGVRKVSGQSM